MNQTENLSPSHLYHRLLIGILGLLLPIFVVSFSSGGWSDIKSSISHYYYEKSAPYFFITWIQEAKYTLK